MRLKTRNSRNLRAFTLLELVVVLAILAVVTAMATRTLSNMEDQRRFESSQQGLNQLQLAVLGSDDERAPDGTRINTGFVADMGRLPQTVIDPTLTPEQLTLRELWVNPGASFDARQATAVNGVPADDVDTQVLVPGGWRGPYIRLPLGANNLLDGWGNGYSSPTTIPSDPDLAATTGYPRLRDASDAAIATPGRSIVLVRNLGADGRLDSSDSTGYNRDQAIAFTDDLVHASLKGSVEVMNGDSPAAADPSGSATTGTVTVKIFAPNPANAVQIVVYKTSVTFTSNPVNYEISPTTLAASAALTIGPRIVRAYFTPASITAPETTFTKSAVKTVVFRPGVNIQDLKIDR